MPLNNSSQSEIWDDSFLIDSWDQALDEYRKYHSMHAKGEKTEAFGSLGESVTVKTCVSDRTEKSGGFEALDDPLVQSRFERSGSHCEHPAPIPGQPLASHIIGQVPDEGLKNLLMSWYYAGYYTGLYEGKQQGNDV